MYVYLSVCVCVCETSIVVWQIDRLVLQFVNACLVSECRSQSLLSIIFTVFEYLIIKTVSKQS